MSKTVVQVAEAAAILGAKGGKARSRVKRRAVLRNLRKANRARLKGGVK